METTLLQKILKWILIGVLGFVGLLVIVVVGMIGYMRMPGVWQPVSVSTDSMRGMMGKYTDNDDRGGMMNRGGRDAYHGSEEVSVAPEMGMNVSGKRGMMNITEGTMVPPMMNDSVARNAEEQKVVKTGMLRLAVKNVDESVAQIKEVVSGKGGFVANLSFYGSAGQERSGTVTVKVPVEKFDEAVQALKWNAVQVISETVSGVDVTEQYIDLSARVKNKKAQEEALQNILKTATKTSDVLEVTRELATVRGDIESLEGQLRYLSAQTDMATITVTLTEDTKVSSAGKELRPFEVVKQAVKTLLGNLGRLGLGLIVFVIAGVPFLLIYGFLIYGVYKLVRRVLRRFFE